MKMQMPESQHKRKDYKMPSAYYSIECHVEPWVVNLAGSRLDMFYGPMFASSTLHISTV